MDIKKLSPQVTILSGTLTGSLVEFLSVTGEGFLSNIIVNPSTNPYIQILIDGTQILYGCSGNWANSPGGINLQMNKPFKKSLQVLFSYQQSSQNTINGLIAYGLK
ncbi:hypothetical protein [Dehalobacter sp. TeCB1]|uniref:hypothetical protein n=1 Tax=Dehalobacter sp. TeCB1 TaxID=1843715 RepID=UPI00083B4096|nr:hypothetical protein [Dehalobacter sp. TeCB1]OCZ54307.1 hypothetical protein A7D23_05935 [Dehalobacter sp. TeCB1]